MRATALLAAESESVMARFDRRAAGSAGKTIVPAASVPLRWEYTVLFGILVLGAWLRFSHLDLLEFQADEAYAANLALQFVQHGKLPSAGLMSSVGVTNPPLFIYLLIPMFAISANPVFVSCSIALLSLAAVAATWRIGRKFYGPVTGLVAAGFFAVSPWAVIYSRKIWAQDFVPIFATATLWAVHALCFGRKPKAIFWALLLPLCVVQIHFSGLALTAAVIVILAWLRPKMNWRYAAAGLATAAILMIPYLRLQMSNGWADFRQAMNTMGGAQQWEKLGGITTQPVSGYRLPSKKNLSYALAIMNSGRIEDVLGISAAREFDRAGVWAGKGNRGYFAETWTLGDWLLVLQRIAFVAGFFWLAFLAMRARVRTPPAILLLWFVVPLAVFYLAGLWTYLTYFAILFPAHFVVLGAAGERALPAKIVAVIAGILVAANVVFMLDYYRFVRANGGAQGTFGTALGIKQQAARYLAQIGGEKLREACVAQLSGRPELQQPPLIELNHEGRPELPQLEWPLLITQAGSGRAEEGAATIVLVDGNREALRPEQWQQLAQYPGTNFGPIKIYVVKS
jgi:4-amino-4-deoxy-L-arabinose transferase-like glycosyltransferase